MTAHTSTSFSSPTALSIIGADRATLEQRLKTAKALDGAYEVLKAAGSSLWDSAYRELGGMLERFLEIDLSEMMIAGWSKYEELCDAGHRTFGTAESIVVDLAGRDLRLQRNPHIDVMVGDKQLFSLTFEVLIDVAAVAVSGVVRDGALVELSTGHCDVTVTIRFANSDLMKETRPLNPNILIPLSKPVILAIE